MTISKIPSKLAEQSEEFQLWFAIEHENRYAGVDVYLIIPRCIGDCSFLRENSVYSTFEGIEFLVMSFEPGSDREEHSTIIYPRHRQGSLEFKGFHISEVTLFSISGRDNTNDDMYFKLKNGNRIHY